MLTNQIERKGVSDGKCRLRCLIWLIGALVLAGILLFVFAVVWLVPGIVQQQVKQRLSGLNEGSVSMGHVQTSYKGQIIVKNAQLNDKAERPWLLADKTTITLSNWPGLHPTIEAVQIDGLDLRLSTKEGRLMLPALRRPESSDGRDKNLDLSKLTINRATFTILDANGVGESYENIALSATRTKDRNYEFMLNKLSGEDSEVLVAGGDVNLQNTEFGVSLRVNHQLTKTESKTALTAMDLPMVSAEGWLEANLKVTGSLNKLSEIQPDGSIELSNNVIFFREKKLADDLALSARLDGQRLDVTDFTATVCRGKVEGRLSAEIKDNQSVEYQGRFLANDVNYPELTAVLTANSAKAERGSFSGNYSFSGRQNDPNALKGEGLIFLNDIDVSIMPVIPTIFKFIGLSRIEPLKTSDAEAKFHNNGNLVTIESGHISNLFAAIEFEPGGKVDLQTEQIDTYVVAAPLSKITGIIERLPIVDIFANLKDKLIRLRVKGSWSDPPSKLISKTPIEDIRDSTVGFIQDVARTGGQFGKGMLDLINGVLNTNKNKNK